MTKEEAVWLLSNFSKLKDNEPTEIVELIEQQAEQIEKLKCCGNCKSWEIILSYGAPTFKCKRESIVIPISTEKCERWEAADNG